jgi:hypothetical protein
MWIYFWAGFIILCILGRLGAKKSAKVRSVFIPLALMGVHYFIFLLVGIFLLLIMVPILAVKMPVYAQQNAAQDLLCDGIFVILPGDACTYDGHIYAYTEWHSMTEKKYEQDLAAGIRTTWITCLDCAGFGLLCLLIGASPLIVLRYFPDHVDLKEEN